MSSIVYQTNPKTGAKYAYESVSYWDKEKQQPRSKRKYLGRVDPETGEIIRSARGAANTDQIEKLEAELKAKDEAISSLQKEIKELTAKYNDAVKAMSKISATVKQFLE